MLLCKFSLMLLFVILFSVVDILVCRFVVSILFFLVLNIVKFLFILLVVNLIFVLKDVVFLGLNVFFLLL